MLRDAETTSIAERMRRPPLGGDTVPAAFVGGGDLGWTEVRSKISPLSLISLFLK